MHGCGWESGAARERSSALAASVASRYVLGADGRWRGRPVRARAPPWQPGPLPRATRTGAHTNSEYITNTSDRLPLIGGSI